MAWNRHVYRVLLEELTDVAVREGSAMTDVQAA